MLFGYPPETRPRETLQWRPRSFQRTRALRKTAAYDRPLGPAQEATRRVISRRSKGSFRARKTCRVQVARGFRGFRGIGSGIRESSVYSQLCGQRVEGGTKLRVFSSRIIEGVLELIFDTGILKSMNKASVTVVVYCDRSCNRWVP